MYLVTSEEMRQLDRLAIDKIGVAAVVLIENAGKAVALEVQALCRRKEGRLLSKWLVLVGKGNNGADGLAAARHLLEAGFQVALVFAEAYVKLTPEAKKQVDIADRLGIQRFVSDEVPIAWSDYDGIIDGLLGTGSKGVPREPYASLIQAANASKLPILAIDIPSGLDADTGAVYHPCIRATWTIALAFMKCGLSQYPGAELAGEVVVRPIGILPSLAQAYGVNTYWLDADLLKHRFEAEWGQARQADSNKGTYGHLLVVAGSRFMSGAGLLSAKAALRAGCGLVTWAVPDRLVDALMGTIPEILLRGIPDLGRGDWAETAPTALLQAAAGKAALVVGPGIGRFPGDCEWLRNLWEGTTCPLVVDADALNMIAEAEDFASWGRRESAVIFTPHPGEMARLAGIPVHEVQRDRIGLARRYASQHGVTLVLKGARTVCATPAGVVFVNTTGNPGMATAGAGDVLAGMLGSLLAQKHSAEHAACLGIYQHGAAGDRAVALRQSAGSLFASVLMASDIIDAL